MKKNTSSNPKGRGSKSQVKQLNRPKNEVKTSETPAAVHITYRDSVLSGITPGVSGNDLLLMSTLGLNGEAGEFSEYVKKWAFHGKPFDKEAMLLELGDIRWYLEAAAISLGTTMAEIETLNHNKLVKRRAERGTLPKAAPEIVK